MAEYQAILPAMMEGSNDLPWVLWKKQEPVSGAQEAKQTDSRLEKPWKEASNAAEMHQPPQVKSAISRQQYFSVVNKIDKASEKISKFTSWGS